MPTTGTTEFALDFTDIAEEAWERAGREMRSGYDLKTARRSMNLLCVEWQNRGLNLWTVDQGTVPLVAGTGTYDLPTDTVDLLEHVIRTDNGDVAKQSDLNITRINIGQYSSIPNKNNTGRPIQLYIDRQRDNPKITLWPVPNSDAYTLVYWRVRRIQDAGAGAENPDLPTRFLPALVSGLAYYLAMKVPELAGNTPILQAEYERQFQLATEEDREKTPLRVVPRMRY